MRVEQTFVYTAPPVRLIRCGEGEGDAKCVSSKTGPLVRKCTYTACLTKVTIEKENGRNWEISIKYS